LGSEIEYSIESGNILSHCPSDILRQLSDRGRKASIREKNIEIRKDEENE